MVRTCSSCGVVTVPEARYCRHCGAPLKVAAAFDDTTPISPLAQTVPLSSEGLTTSGLGADEAGGSGSETKRVGQAEMEQLLRRSRFEVAPDVKVDEGVGTKAISDYAAPPTGELAEVTNAPAIVAPVAAPVQSSAPVRAEGSAQRIIRLRRAWMLIMGLLLLAMISAAALAYYFLRQRTPQSASNAPPLLNSNQAAELANTNSQVEEVTAGDAKPQEETPLTEETPRVEATPQPTPKPSASIEPTREARLRQERATETPAPSAAETPAASPSPVAQATPQQTPAPSPAAANSNSGAPQTTSDAFYFQAVNIVNGRDPRALKRAELLRALQLFQNVTSGQHVVEARRHAGRLIKELNRLDKQSQR